jgi:hypothetical protein
LKFSPNFFGFCYCPHVILVKKNFQKLTPHFLKIVVSPGTRAVIGYPADLGGYMASHLGTSGVTLRASNHED